MLTTYLEEAERRLATLNDLAPCQREAIHVEAHTLKGSLAQLGARATAELAQQIESAARTSAPGRSETVIKELELQAAQIQRLLNELATSPEL